MSSNSLNMSYKSDPLSALGLQMLDKPTYEEINKAYKSRALELHPDKNPDNSEATAQFQELGHAYRTCLEAYTEYGEDPFDWPCYNTNLFEDTIPYVPHKPWDKKKGRWFKVDHRSSRGEKEREEQSMMREHLIEFERMLAREAGARPKEKRRAKEYDYEDRMEEQKARRNAKGAEETPRKYEAIKQRQNDSSETGSCVIQQRLVDVADPDYVDNTAEVKQITQSELPRSKYKASVTPCHVIEDRTQESEPEAETESESESEPEAESEPKNNYIEGSWEAQMAAQFALDCADHERRINTRKAIREMNVKTALTYYETKIMAGGCLTDKNARDMEKLQSRALKFAESKVLRKLEG